MATKTTNKGAAKPPAGSGPDKSAVEKEVKNPGASRVPGRQVKYKTVQVCGIDIPPEKRIMTPRYAKDLLGWITEKEFEAEQTKGLAPELVLKMTENVKFGNQFFLEDLQGNKVQVNNNVENRPYDGARALGHAQDILKGNWKFNGESWIVGTTGLTLSMQHRAIGLILAEQMLLEDSAQGAHWRELWGWIKEPGTKNSYVPGKNGKPFQIEALVVTGISEDPSVTRTIDNVKPRTLSDILFADTSIFGKKSEKDKQQLSKMTEYALKFVWDRTGAKNDAFSPKRTHSESVDFILNHRRLVDCVAHIHSENAAESVITKVVSTGTAAGLMFLMACSEQDADKSAEVRTEWFGGRELKQSALSFANYEKAQAFWSQVGNTANTEFDDVRTALSALKQETGLHVPVSHKTAVLCLAWNEYVLGGTPTAPNCKPLFTTVDGDPELKEIPSVGGVDDPVQPNGKRLSTPEEEEVPTEVPEGEGEEGAEEDDGPSEEEIAEIEAAKAEALAKKKGKK